MEQIEKLWEFQKADMTCDRFEREIQKNANRQQLLKYREFMLQQQEAMKRIESEVDAMGDRMENLRAEISHLEEELLDLQDTLKEKEPETIEIARKSLSYAQKLRRDADARDKQQHEVRVRAAKVRAEFDALKKVYDGEYHEQAVQLQKLRAEAAKAAEGIEPKLLAKYKEIKQHTVPPIARLVDGNRCGGCNMNMPQVIMGRRASSGGTVSASV